jgi:hypothetical protein
MLRHHHCKGGTCVRITRLRSGGEADETPLLSLIKITAKIKAAEYTLYSNSICIARDKLCERDLGLVIPDAIMPIECFQVDQPNKSNILLPLLRIHDHYDDDDGTISIRAGKHVAKFPPI